MLPSWIIEKKRKEQEKEERPILHAPQPEPPQPVEQLPREVHEDPRGTTEIDFTL